MKKQRLPKKSFIVRAGLVSLLVVFFANLIAVVIPVSSVSAANVSGSFIDSTAVNINGNLYTDKNPFDRIRQFVYKHDGCENKFTVNSGDYDVGHSDGIKSLIATLTTQKVSNNDCQNAPTDKITLGNANARFVNAYLITADTIWMPIAEDYHNGNVGAPWDAKQFRKSKPADTEFQLVNDNGSINAFDDGGARIDNINGQGIGRYQMNNCSNFAPGCQTTTMETPLVIANFGKISTPDPKAHPNAPKVGANGKIIGSSDSSDSSSAAPQCNGGLSGILDNPLNWLICPLVNAITTAFEAFDGIVTNLLTIQTVKLFGAGYKADQDHPVSVALYTAWSSFRFIAMGLLVIFALIMIISQAIASGPFDAYTVKRVVPRMLAAIVLIALSWQLMGVAIAISNGIGHSVGSLIYKPFSLIPGGVNDLNETGASGLLGFAAGGALIVLGPIGLLTFALTGLIAALTAFGVLVLREMIIVLLVVLAPIALVCNILPNTQRVWKMWTDYFMRALFLFPLFAGFVALGRVFSKIAVQLHPDALGSIIGFVAYLAPYFLLPTLFKMSGGAMAAIGGFAAGATAGMRGGLSKYRAGRRAERMSNAGARAKRGEFLPSYMGRVGGGAVNRRIAGVASGTKGGFGLGKRGMTAEDGMAFEASRNRMKTDDWQNQMYKDNAMKALTYKSAAEAKAAGIGDDDINAARIAAGSGGWSKSNQLAAAQQLAMNKTGYKNAAEAMETISRVAGNNGIMGDSLRENIKFTSKQVGRNDMGALSAQRAGETDTQWNDRMTSAGFENVDTYSLGREHAVSYLNMATAHANQYDEAVQAYGAAPTEDAKNGVIETRTRLEETIKNAGSATGNNARVATRLTSLISGPDTQLRAVSRDAAGNLDGGVSILGQGTAPDPNRGASEGAVGSGGLARAQDEEYRRRRAQDGDQGAPKGP